MAFRKTFTVSTEKINSHGFRVLTAGIRLDAARENCPAFYDHQYWKGTVGHWENLRVEGTKLVADFVSEGITEAEREIIKKIEAGDIKGASIGADPITWSDDHIYLINGQSKPTLIESELFEISVTPLPGNNQALCLKKDGQPVALNATNAQNIIPDLKPQENMKAIALKLGLNENATEAEIVEAINKVQLSRDASVTLTKDILDKAAEGLTKEQEEIFVTLSATNPKQAIAYADSVKLSEAPANAAFVEKTTTVQKDVKVSDLINLGKGKEKEAAEGKDSFDYLSKHNPVELRRILDEEPEKYAQLCRDYKTGVRYTGKA